MNDPDALQELLRGMRSLEEGMQTFQASVREDMRKLRDKQSEVANRSLEEHEKTRRHVGGLTKRVDKIWDHVFGSSNPPPPSENEAGLPMKSTLKATAFALGEEDLAFSLTEPSTAPGKSTRSTPIPGPALPHSHKRSLTGSVSDHESTLASVEGKIIALSAGQNETHKQVETLLALQKEQMGKKDGPETRSLLRRFVEGSARLVMERDGRRFLVQLIGTIAALVAAVATLLATYRRVPVSESRGESVGPAVTTTVRGATETFP